MQLLIETFSCALECIAFVDKELRFCIAIVVCCCAVLTNAIERADAVHFSLEYDSELHSFVVCFGCVGPVLINALENATMQCTFPLEYNSALFLFVLVE